MNFKILLMVLLVVSFVYAENISYTNYYDSHYSDKEESVDDAFMEYYKNELDIKLKELEIYLKKGMVNDPDTVIFYNKIAKSYDKLQDYDLAVEYYKKALKVNLRLYNKQDVICANSFEDVAKIYQKMGRYDDALDNYKNVLDIRKIILGSSHPQTIVSYHDMGYMYYKQNEVNKALEYENKAFDILKKNSKEEESLNLEISSNSINFLKDELDFSKNKKNDKKVKKYDFKKMINQKNKEDTVKISKNKKIEKDENDKREPERKELFLQNAKENNPNIIYIDNI